MKQTNTPSAPSGDEGGAWGGQVSYLVQLLRIPLARLVLSSSCVSDRKENTLSVVLVRFWSRVPSHLDEPSIRQDFGFCLELDEGTGSW